MAGRGWMLAAAGLLAACQPPTVDTGMDAPRTAVIATSAPVMNVEYGVGAVFPVGARVCEALSGEHPHGFYSRLGDPRMDCVPSRDPPKVSGMTIWADYNAGFQNSGALADPSCPNRNPAMPDGRPAAFPGRGSVACETRLANGDVEVSVRTFAGSQVNTFAGPDGDETETVPAMIYSAYLHTTAAAEARDKAAFRRFLDQVVFIRPETELDGPECVWTRAVLVAANGTPSLRLRVEGRRGLTGVTSPNGSEAPDALPPDVWTALRSRGDVFGTEVAGDYRLCPWTTPPGAMPLARVAGARDLSVRVR